MNDQIKLQIMIYRVAGLVVSDCHMDHQLLRVACCCVSLDVCDESQCVLWAVLSLRTCVAYIGYSTLWLDNE